MEMTSKRCIQCLTLKSYKNFYRSNEYKDGHMSRCKDCYKASSKREEFRGESGIDVTILNEESFLMMYDVLFRMGYDINTDIHQQFINKVNENFGIVLEHKEEPHDEVWQIKQRLNERSK